MRVLVTGADGFVAQFLIPHLREEGHAVVGTALAPAQAAALAVDLHPLDITDPGACRAVLATVRPTHLVHLAAASSVAWSFAHPEETVRINVGGTENVLAAAAAAASPPRVLVVGSGEEYGANDGRPLRELPADVLRPLSPYAVSKAEMERRIERDPRFRALAIRTRSFTHIGPGQRTGFFAADVAAQLVRMAQGELPPVLRVGNVDAVRDVTDVRDVVRAYRLLLERGEPGEVYNVCTGHGVLLRDLVEQLTTYAGVKVQLAQDQKHVRPSEIPVLVGDPTKLCAATEWTPAIPLTTSLEDVLDWWRAHTPAAAAARAGAP